MWPDTGPRMSKDKPRVLLKVSDLLLEDTTTELLEPGFRVAVEAGSGQQFHAIVCDVAFAEAAARQYPDARLILVNVSDEKSLVGKTALLEIAGFVPRPANARRIRDTLQTLVA